jgi:hypothetical protein
VRKRIRNSLVIGMLLMLTVMSGPADAGPLQSVTASAYGASVTGAVPISPTPTVSATFPPAAQTQNAALLEIPAEPLAFSGTATVRAQTTGESTLTPVLPANKLTVQGGGAMPAGFNARATARVEGLEVLSSIVDPEILDPLALIAVGVIESEALVACVAERPVFVTGTRLAGPVSVAGLDLATTTDDLLESVVAALNIPGVLEARSNVVTQVPGGYAVIALQVAVLGTTLVVNLAQSQISGGVCADIPDCRDMIDNDGDGLIDFNPPPGAQRDPGCESPDDDSEVNILPRTGGNGPGLGIAILAAGGLLMLATVKKRRETS